ncbi:MAG: dienelactone hydrolase family protein [Planctomycetia bacterium]|nr:dienelactone hydrolase family protein [Planctomycetia bacterium]
MKTVLGKTILIMAVIAICLLFIVVACLCQYQSQLIFPGQGKGGDSRADLERLSRQPAVNEQAIPVTLASGLKTWVRIVAAGDRLPDATANDHYLVLFFYGNCGRLDWFGEFAAPFLNCNLDFACIEWPGFGVAEGRPSERNCYEAADSLWRVAQERFGYRPEHVIIAGYSMGVGLACELATRYSAGGLILFSGFTSMPDIAQYHFPYLPVRWFLTTHFDNRDKLSKISSPCLLLHGTADTIVPFRMAEENEQSARTGGCDVTLHALPEGDHEVFDEPVVDLLHTPLTEFVNKIRARNELEEQLP